MRGGELGVARTGRRGFGSPSASQRRGSVEGNDDSARTANGLRRCARRAVALAFRGRVPWVSSGGHIGRSPKLHAALHALPRIIAVALPTPPHTQSRARMRREDTGEGTSAMASSRSTDATRRNHEQLVARYAQTLTSNPRREANEERTAHTSSQEDRSMEQRNFIRKIHASFKAGHHSA